MTIILTLGDIIFSGFEIPENIGGTGGEQALVVHKLPGGARTVDAMGPDDDDIVWSGRFRGANAESRARILEGYRTGGQVWLLQWSTYRYQVIVRSFKPDYRQPFEIPYSISCFVVANESAPILTGIPGLDELIGSDLGNAIGLSGSLGIAQVATAVSTVQQTVSAAGTLQGASAGSIAGVASSIAAAQQVVGASATAASGTISASTPIIAGGNPAAMASSLNSQASAFGQLDQFNQITNTLTRMGKNLAA